MDGSLTINGPKHLDDSHSLREPSPFRPLKNLDARLISLLDMAADSICLMDNQSRILLFNKASETLFGYSAEEVIGQSVNILMPDKYAKHHDGWVHRYLETGEHSIIGIGREVQGKKKDGSIFPFDLSVGVTQTENGPEFIGVIRDLGARKQTEKRLRTLQTELNQMTRINAMDEMGATIAHELNQPLTAIILYLQAIERKLQLKNGADNIVQDDLDQLSDLCGRAVQEAQRSASLLQRIRSIIEKNEPERSPCDIVEIIRKAHELALVGFAATDVHIELICPKKVPLVSADPVQIEQIFLNLLRNAFQAMRDVDHKEIMVSVFLAEATSDRPERVKVLFKDTGPGIPQEHRTDLFKAFNSKRRNGMGLGLAIAHSISQTHGGSLELAPHDDNQPGACFILTLPLASPVKAKMPDDSENVGDVDGNKKPSASAIQSSIKSQEALQ
ncbi:two-component system sensor histidine kinase NtrB [Cohaesibacter celericrescens]|uniref:Sensor protein FixL n=1 Tax=Cohaesibacter celericrescens TaxID=2067669 RepID=A0A2N5XK42_9HYPH|nr:PAS domain S-box protein [Cohaesibacter celericrescens]PLW74889.1 PAS domain-containing sensor histidine kinase [Cohaesibacter celericrescens]